MLTEIKVAEQATYPTSGETLDGLKKINFIFGSNGAGKTTISRVMADPAAYEKCTLTWERGKILETLVYNRDFVEQNYKQRWNAIFTLGKLEDDILARIEIAKKKVSDLQEAIAKEDVILGAENGSSGKRGELRKLRADFEAECWQIKVKHDSNFKDAFSGTRNSQVKFCDKVLSEFADNKAQLRSFDDLIKRAATLFMERVERHEPIAPVQFDELIAIESRTILAKRVVGKDDVDVAGLIKRLGNSDWVRQGLNYIESGDQCPFCQQKIEADLADRLNAFFDETYLNDMAEIGKAIESYTVHARTTQEKIQALLLIESKYLDANTLGIIADAIVSRMEINKRILDRKRKEPSSPIVLESISETALNFTSHVTKAIEDINEHNALVENIKAERASLILEIWRYILNENVDVINKYSTGKVGVERAIASLTSRIEDKKRQLVDANLELRQLEASVTSVQPTVTAINQLLRSFGFTGFSLRTAGERNQFYELVREDGKDAGQTLSEGEKSFVSFLYFYNLIRGSVSESGVMASRVIVFDDPVSSLDSDVLFVVGSLIKRTLKEAIDGNSQIKQVFVLTHNIYFHREVSFDNTRDVNVCRSHETFWTVRKINGVSSLTKHPNNPIKTSYELLWQELRSPTRNNSTIQNTMRRIIENYFKILGGIDRETIISLFDGNDQQICASLFSWVNDGSHNALDDLHVVMNDSVVSRYLDVFKEIFVRSKHEGHYNMMMSSSSRAQSASTASAVAPHMVNA